MTNPNKIGLLLAAIIGGWHVCWALLILAGWAQTFIDFIFWAHMIRSIYVVKPFDPVAAVTLVVVTGMMGYIWGYFGALLWNKLRSP